MRGEARFNRILKQNASSSNTKITNLLFDQIFSDNTTNIVIMELWHLSLRDEVLRLRLASVYRRIVSGVSALIKEDVTGKDAKRVSDVALAAVSLAFGTAFFKFIGLTANNPLRVRSRVENVIADINVKTASHFKNKELK